MSIIFKENIYFIKWIIEVAEDKIYEHRLIKKKFFSNEEFIVFTIIWMRVYKKIYNEIKEEKQNIKIDKYIKGFYKNQKNKYLGVTINAITRETEIPRTTVKRHIERLIKKKLVIRNSNRLIIPTFLVRDFMKDYREFINSSYKKLSKLYYALNLNDN